LQNFHAQQVVTHTIVCLVLTGNIKPNTLPVYAKHTTPKPNPNLQPNINPKSYSNPKPNPTNL